MLRDRFVIPPSPDGSPAIELRAFTHGLMPATVPAMMQRFAEDWQTHGVDAWNEVPNHWDPADGTPVGWWTLPTYLGDRFVARLLGAPAGTCTMQPNAHWSVQCLLSAPEPFATGRNEVVISATAFPSVQHSARQWAAVRGYDLRVVPPGADGFVDRQAVLDAIGPKTAWVFLSHVGFTTGERLPDAFLQDVATTAHRHGGLFVLDGYHANATMPIDVLGLGADAYVGGLLKEASGSSGNGILYVRAGLDLTPALTGWFGDADPFGFAAAPLPHPEVRRRFLGGTTAVASLYHAVEGVRVLLETGLDAVRADSLAKTEIVIERAEAAGLRLRSPREPERRSAMVIFEVAAADRLCEYLKTRGVYTDSRQGRFLRLAPWVWNTTAEVERALDEIAAAIRSGSHHAFEAPIHAGPVT
ncbi:MAG: aminotransferase class V-fold PLP-dependent enzyme [Bacteroidota bacterium]